MINYSLSYKIIDHANDIIEKYGMNSFDKSFFEYILSYAKASYSYEEVVFARSSENVLIGATEEYKNLKSENDSLNTRLSAFNKTIIKLEDEVTDLRADISSNQQLA